MLKGKKSILVFWCFFCKWLKHFVNIEWRPQAVLSDGFTSQLCQNNFTQPQNLISVLINESFHYFKREIMRPITPKYHLKKKMTRPKFNTITEPTLWMSVRACFMHSEQVDTLHSVWKLECHSCSIKSGRDKPK